MQNYFQAAEARSLLYHTFHIYPFFNTEQVIAKEKAEELGYEVKCASHDDDAATQLELFEAAINDGAAAIICDNAGADASIEQFRKHMTLESRLSLSTVRSTSPDLQ